MASPGIGNLPKRRTPRLTSGRHLRPIYGVKTGLYNESDQAKPKLASPGRESGGAGI